MTDLDGILRHLLHTAAGLGHTAATIGIPRNQALDDVAHGPEADRLLTAITPLIRTAAQATP